MIMLGMNPEIARYAGEMNRPYLAAAALYSYFDLFKVYITSHRVFAPILYIHALTVLIHPLWAWLFIEKLHLGLNGVALARLLEEVINLAILLAIYLTNSTVGLSRGTFERSCLKFKYVIKQAYYSIKVGVIQLIDTSYF